MTFRLQRQRVQIVRNFHPLYPPLRSDITDAYRIFTEDITRKNPRARAIDEHTGTMIQMGRHIEATVSNMVEPRKLDKLPDILVYHGPTATGKSERAHATLPEAFVWGPSLGKWWGNYFAQEDIIMEEFRGQIPLGEMLQLCDKYEHTVEVKNGFRTFRGSRFVITSPMHPKDWYKNMDNDRIDQLLRRITTIQYTGPTATPPVVTNRNEAWLDHEAWKGFISD